MQKKIIHIDMDYFFAAIEIKNNPKLAYLPVAVGGKVEQRGVISTCNYVARKYGIHSAMPSFMALKKCPKLILLPVNMPLYKSVSEQIHLILKGYTDLIEPISLDEAYLDVTNHLQEFANSATLVAQDIKQKIYEQTGLTASAGVAPLKFLAKIASDYNKPNGIYTIAPNQVENFIDNLPLAKIPGVGNITVKKLNNLNLYKCSDIKEYDLFKLTNMFGKLGVRIWQFSHAIDNREIKSNRPRKSIGVETTLLEDIDDLEQAIIVIENLYEKLVFRMNRYNASLAINNYYLKHGLKLKFSDFQQTTIERKNFLFNKENFITLLKEIWQRKNNRKIRLIGLQVQLPEIMKDDMMQGSLF